MALILHLTDLHLGADQQIGDNKTGIPIDMPTRDGVYKNTLHNLCTYLQEHNRHLDCVIVSGDITKYNKEDGFEMLDDVLSALGAKKPKNNKIIILPGNHDVTWKIESKKGEKYNYFNTHIRQKGYITPYLDGLETPKNIIKCGILSLDTENIQIVPINTSNYCGTYRPLKEVSVSEETKIKEIVEGQQKGKELWAEFEKIRLHDISRVSKEQFAHLKKVITLKSNKKPSKKKLLRIAVSHHHIAPVSTYEEFKTFESVTNVGELNNFLREHNFQAILHGHKHKQSVYWKLLPDYDKPFNEFQDESPILVVSGATLAENSHDKKDIFRLIEINNDDNNPTIEILPIDGSDIGGNFKDPSGTGKKYNLNSLNISTTAVSKQLLEPVITSTQQSAKSLESSETDSLITNISGSDVNETYDKIIDTFKNANSKLISQVICELKTAPDLYTLPASYDFGNDDAEKMKERVQEWVEWWGQEKTILEGYKYTHGQRVFSYNHINQITKRIVPILKKNIKEDKPTSRGYVSLYNPVIDDLLVEANEFPHFMSMQFVISNRNNQKYLDCIAYFRKQEMRYWWPINVAEITNFLHIIRKEVGDETLNIGSIITITILAYAGKKHAIPAFAVPKIDILFDEYRRSYSSENSDLKKNQLWKLIYSLFHSVADSELFKNEWEAILDELTPREHRDPNAVLIAISGIEYVINQIGLYTEFQPNENVNKFNRELGILLELNQGYSKKSKEATDTDYKKWREKSSTSIDELKKHLVSIYQNLELKV